MTRRLPTLPQVFLALAFLAPRLVFLGWFLNGSALFNDCACTVREISACGEGTWISWARDLSEGRTPPAGEDMGVSVAISALHKVGLPFEAGYWTLIGAFHLGGLVLLLLLYRKLVDDGAGSWEVAAALGALALYPPGWYMSVCNVVRVFSVYAFLGAAVVMVYRDRLFAAMRPRHAAAIVGAAFAFVVMNFVRSSNRPIAVALALALVVYAARVKAARWAVALFILAYAGWTAALRPVFPKSEHLFWHPMYIFLSDFDRTYGIQHSDEWAMKTATENNPRIAADLAGPNPPHVLAHPEYEPTLKRLYMEKVTSNPAWFARILALRTLKLVAMPIQGSWAPPLTPKQEDAMVRFGDLTSTARWRQKIYVTVDTITPLLDLAAVFLGFLAIVFGLRSWGWSAVEWGLLLAAVLYVYVIVGTANRTAYLAGTYVYLFLGHRFLQTGARRLPFAAMDVH